MICGEMSLDEHVDHTSSPFSHVGSSLPGFLLVFFLGRTK